MKELIKTLCNSAGVGGCRAISDTIKEIVAPLVHEVHCDTLGNIVAIRRCGKEQAPLLLLEAHLDEIGFVVTHVDDGGFIHVANCGGVDRRVLAATEVTVLAEKTLNGVFCSTPPHLASGDSKITPLDEMRIDVGLPADTVKELVMKGTRVSFRADYCELNEHTVCSKALDNRAGCAAVIRALEMLQEQSLSCDVAALFAVQEEVGGAGAITASFRTEPSMAIVTDVSFAVTPDAAPHKCGVLGKGPMLGMAPALDREMADFLKALATTHEIPLQYEVMGSTTGTDADAINTSRGGVRTALLSIPQRYMHTPIETVDVRDVEYIAKLMAEAAKGGIVSC